MLDFLSGAISMGYVLAGAFFLKFWSRTRDELFLAFATAFALLALEQILLFTAGLDREEQTWLYLMRLTAFLLIIGAILRKNRRNV